MNCTCVNNVLGKITSIAVTTATTTIIIIITTAKTKTTTAIVTSTIIIENKIYINEKCNCKNEINRKYYYYYQQQQQPIIEFYINSNNRSNRCRHLIKILYKNYFPFHYHLHYHQRKKQKRQRLQQQQQQQQQYKRNEYNYIKKLSCIINLIINKILTVINNIENINIIIINNNNNNNSNNISININSNLRRILIITLLNIQIMENNRHFNLKCQRKSTKCYFKANSSISKLENSNNNKDSSSNSNYNNNEIHHHVNLYQLFLSLLFAPLFLLFLLLHFFLCLLRAIIEVFVDLLFKQQQKRSQQQQYQLENQENEKLKKNDKQKYQRQLHVQHHFHDICTIRLITFKSLYIKQQKNWQQLQQQQQYHYLQIIEYIYRLLEYHVQQQYKQNVEYFQQVNKKWQQHIQQKLSQQYIIKCHIVKKERMKEAQELAEKKQEDIKEEAEQDSKNENILSTVSTTAIATTLTEFIITTLFKIVCIERKRPLFWLWLWRPWQLYYYKPYHQLHLLRQQQRQQQQKLYNIVNCALITEKTEHFNKQQLSEEKQQSCFKHQYLQQPQQIKVLQDISQKCLYKYLVVNNNWRYNFLQGFPSILRTTTTIKLKCIQQIYSLLTWTICVNNEKLLTLRKKSTAIIFKYNSYSHNDNKDDKNNKKKKYKNYNILSVTFAIIMWNDNYVFVVLLITVPIRIALIIIIATIVIIAVVALITITINQMRHITHFNAIIIKSMLRSLQHENQPCQDLYQNKKKKVKTIFYNYNKTRKTYGSNSERTVAKKLKQTICKRRPKALSLTSAVAVPTFSSTLSLSAVTATVTATIVKTAAKPIAMPIVNSDYHGMAQQQQQHYYYYYYYYYCTSLFSIFSSLPLTSSVCLSSSSTLSSLSSISISSPFFSSLSLPFSSSSSLRLFFYLILLSSLWRDIECFHGSAKLSANTVKTKYGLLRGIIVRSSPLVEAYLGIPYASPPVGSLRFMPPITPSTWKNVRNADRFSPVCPQTVPVPPNGPEALLEVPRARLAQLRRLLPLLSNQSEDCLYLNIYVPYENNRRHNNGKRFSSSHSHENFESNKLPTILFIHGESYEWNSGNPYDGSELAAHGNIIVVTINFRLGIFGFLKTGGKESAQGNFGLMDLVAGLHWLKENLPAFGGDPQSITLLGHGTGAALANILIVSPVANDLIQRTVLVSGSALSPWAIQKNPLFIKRCVAEQTGCHGDMLYDDLAPCLRTKSVTELLAVQIDYPRFLVGFAPFIDGTVISPNTNAYTKLTLPLGSTIVSTSGIEYANFPKRNLIFCLTSVESHLDLSAQDLEFGFNETRRDRILRTYVRNNFHYHLNEIFAVVKNEYTDWDKAIRSPLSSRDATLAFLSDAHTASSLIKLGYMHNLRGGKTYFLHFKHRTVEEEYPQRTGSVRGEDVPFWLGLPISPLFPHNYTLQERQISHLMLRYLVNFAKTGNPNQSSLHTQSPQPTISNLNNIFQRNFENNENNDNDDDDNSDENLSPENKFINIKRSSNQKLNVLKMRRSTFKVPNMTEENSAKITAKEAVNLAIIYNQRRTKRTYFLHQSLNDNDNDNIDHGFNSESDSDNSDYSTINSGTENSKDLPYWDAYDVVNQLYLELAGNKAEIQSHYRGHKLSMWLNLIPQLHRHTNMNDLSMRHHHFQDDINHMNLYEGIVRPQLQFKPNDDDENNLLFSTIRAIRTTTTAQPLPPQSPSYQATKDLNTTLRLQGGTTECAIDGSLLIGTDLSSTTQSLTVNDSLIELSREKDVATVSTGLIGNLEVLRRLSSKQFQSYTTALVATVAVGCFLLILNILIFAGIYHQREKRARDAKTKEELQDNDTSKSSSLLKLNTIGSESGGSFNDSTTGLGSKSATIIFGEYTCYDEKSSLGTKDEKLIVDLKIPSIASTSIQAPPSASISAIQLADPATWGACSSGTLDLLKTKNLHAGDIQKDSPNNTYKLESAQMKSTISQTTMPLNTIELRNYANNATSHIGPMGVGPTYSTTQINPFDYAFVQSSDQMSFKDIENAVKVKMNAQYNHRNNENNDIDNDNHVNSVDNNDDIPEPPPPPKLFQNVISAGTSGGSGGILRQTGGANSTTTSSGKKRVHIQEISV